MTISTSRPRRTGHPPISYRDSSTDDEVTNIPHTRSSQRSGRATRPRSSSEEDSDSVDELRATTSNHNRSRASSGNTSLAIRSSRRVRNVTNYNEDSEAEYGEAEQRLTQHSNPKPNPPRNQRKQRRPGQVASNKGPFHSFKRRKTNPDTSRNVGPTKIASIPAIPPGKIPPWQTLPYQILLSILQYASYPFYRDASHDTGSIAWLIEASTLSKSFREAAVATLLYSPPLFPSDRAHGLQRLLDASQDTLSTTYRNKVKRLDVEVRNLLIKKRGIDLLKLIKQTPLLYALHLYHNYDRVGSVAWAQPSASRGRSWSYPLELFDTLDENEIRLKEWTWNGRFPDTNSVLDQMKQTRHRESLRGLTSLSILNLAAPEKVKGDEKGAPEGSLTTALKSLPDLRELTLQNCGIVNQRVLGSLPSHLQHLSIINCGNFNSGDLRLYLAQHGYELEELILNGNQALDLGFAGSLESLCPRLQLFRIDLTYTDPTAFHDVDPHYEAVFPDGIMPTWPRTLQTINIENLRNLDAQDAENFLQSLIAIALELKDLRKLSIRILLQDDGWRERAKLRQIWMPKLEDVFLRQDAPPNPFIPASLQPPPFPSTTALSRPSTSHSNSSTSFTTDDSTAATPNKRKSARIAKREIQGLAHEAFGKAAEFSKEKTKLALRDDRTDDNDLDGELPRQGMCSEVILHIDGQRPADEQFKEADFLDDELSGDEDWNGKDVEAPSRYAW
jgi:hypothetical protein